MREGYCRFAGHPRLGFSLWRSFGSPCAPVWRYGFFAEVIKVNARARTCGVQEDSEVECRLSCGAVPTASSSTRGSRGAAPCACRAGGEPRKLWLEPVRIQESGGFGAKEINRIAALVEEHQEELLRAWNEYFND